MLHCYGGVRVLLFVIPVLLWIGTGPGSDPVISASRAIRRAHHCDPQVCGGGAGAGYHDIKGTEVVGSLGLCLQVLVAALKHRDRTDTAHSQVVVSTQLDKGAA